MGGANWGAIRDSLGSSHRFLVCFGGAKFVGGSVWVKYIVHMVCSQSYINKM